MKTRLAAAFAALVLGVAAPLTSAAAFTERAPITRDVPVQPFLGLGSHDGPLFDRCPASSASEGNANQQNFPTKQYGQTSGGTRC